MTNDTYAKAVLNDANEFLKVIEDPEKRSLLEQVLASRITPDLDTFSTQLIINTLADTFGLATSNLLSFVLGRGDIGFLKDVGAPAKVLAYVKKMLSIHGILPIFLKGNTWYPDIWASFYLRTNFSIDLNLPIGSLYIQKAGGEVVKIDSTYANLLTFVGRVLRLMNQDILSSRGVITSSHIDSDALKEVRENLDKFTKTVEGTAEQPKSK